ncbi:MAG: TetR/AcrR family transcriptional regulator [Rikenellaceae bacterium]|nr:TetR/AcrR family transcriptional regulator [Rikenellaceae bacterium]
MCPKDINNQRLILEAAEAEFLDKGYEKARTTQIAKRAGVNHAMLHYYFQSKEKLFNVIFENKAKMMHEILLFHLGEDMPFLDKIKTHIEQHFDFVAANEKIPGFIISETLHNPKLRELFVGSMTGRAREVFSSLKKEIDKEASKGNIRRVDPYDLVMSIVSLNCFCFLNYRFLPDVLGVDKKMVLEERKKINVEIILNWLRI